MRRSLFYYFGEKMNIVGFPSSYRQGPGLLDDLGEACLPFGTRPLVVADGFVQNEFRARLDKTFAKSNITPIYEEFRGECSPDAIAKATKTAIENDCDFIVGLGGGKAIDTAKGVKIETSLKIMIVPTIASNDSPTSRLAITYSDEGDFLGPRFLPFNPEAILVDTAIIASAPTRFFTAGIGDALVTKFEADQCRVAGANNFFGGQPTEAAMALSDHCYKIVRQYGAQAVLDVDRKEPTEAVEKVTEANVLLSGLGFEGCGVAGAHAIGMALSLLPEIKGILHGEEVAIGLLAQFVLEGRDDEFFKDQLDFFRSVRLPASLPEVGFNEVCEDRLSKVAAFAVRNNSRLHNMSFPISERMVLEALLRSDEIVRSYDAARLTTV